MKKITMAVTVGILMSVSVFAQEKAGKKDTTQHTVIYTCPKHSDVVSNEPGKCPKCGMDLKLSTKEEMKMEVTKAYSCPIHKDVTSHNPGKCPQCGRKLNLSPKEQMKAEVTKIYTCPMHPDVSLDKDGKCPKCGRALVEKKSQ
jgi:transcription initiation factor IIE alpha subunit